MKKSILVAATLLAAAASQAKAQYVNIGLSIGCPPPVYMAPPQVVFTHPLLWVGLPPMVIPPPPVVMLVPLECPPRMMVCGRPEWSHPHREFHHR